LKKRIELGLGDASLGTGAIGDTERLKGTDPCNDILGVNGGSEEVTNAIPRIGEPLRDLAKKI
jgi:hypothetical protein